MTIEIYLHEDKNFKETYQINVLSYESAKVDELELLREIDMTCATWLGTLETEKDDLPFS